MRRLLIGSVGFLLVSGPALGTGPAAKVADLAWMTGHYKGATGDGFLEENWGEPDGGSIASLARSTSGGVTNMIALVVIEEEGASLTLRLQQWDPRMKPRAEGIQVMELIEIGDNTIVFQNTGTAGLQQLGYSLNGDQFTISLKTEQGLDMPVTIPLTRQPAQAH